MDPSAKAAPSVSAAQVEAAVSAAANATSLPTAEVIGKQPMTQFYQVGLGDGDSTVLWNCFKHGIRMLT